MSEQDLGKEVLADVLPSKTEDGFAAHTRGPWEDTGVFIEADGEALAEVKFLQRPSIRLGELERVANARLIAAAPDLLAAAKSQRIMLYAWKAARSNFGLSDDHGELARAIAETEAAISQATGQEP